jgi:ribosomal protein L22
MAAATNPDPDSRARWERKMVIREIKKSGRLTKTQILKREEREILSKSHDLKTSVKKLGPLARQIAGKPIEEAIVQMRFSKKKAAKDVREHLEFARNEAIVRRGMGLGSVNGTKGEPTNIMTKEGKRMRIKDRTGLYVDQAWVGKGPYGVTPDHRARGQINLMKNPTTSKSTENSWSLITTNSLRTFCHIEGGSYAYQITRGEGEEVRKQKGLATIAKSPYH